MGRTLLMLAATLAIARPASAEGPAVALEVSGPLPCSEAELLSAVQLRLRLEPGAPILRLAKAGLDAFELSYQGQRRVVPLYGAQGRAAARRLSLAIVDLVFGELEVRLPEVRTATPTATVAISRVLRPAPPPSVEVAPRRCRAAAWLQAGGGSNLDRPSLGLGLEGWWGLSGPWFTGLELGLAWVPPGEAQGLPVTLWALPIRGGVAYVGEALELRAMAFVSPHRVGGGDQAVELGTWGWVAGTSLQAGLHFELEPPLELLLLLGLDLAFNRRAYAVGGVEALATERAQLWLALGLGFGGPI